MPPPPFLPARPVGLQNNAAAPTHASSSQAAFALQSALANPYTHSYSSHYAQAYMQYSPMPLTNAHGYTLSSAYNPNAAVNNPNQAFTHNWTNPAAAGPSYSRSQSGAKLPNFGANSSWYQSGNNRCTHNNCPFTGSAKSVEIHMMDRHLIFPPGWDKRKNKDWDADPSLKGKTVPIQGTNAVLDTPDAIDAWVQERKKRWPSRTLVEEKKRKLEEASARGQLSVDALGLFSKKRRKIQDSSEHSGGGDRFRGNGRGRGRGRGNNWTRGSSDSGWKGRGNSGRGDIGRAGEANPVDTPTPIQKAAPDKKDSDGSSSDSDGEPEVLSSKAPSHIPPVVEEPTEQALDSTVPTYEKSKPRKPAAQPKKPPHNPFAPRTSLLRNLLIPEIRMTVSNLSQAIRFLVDNDFLDGVELKPGEADEPLIKVLDPEALQKTSSDAVVP